MKGLDTNILVRYIVQDDKKQSEVASAYIRRTAAVGESFFINHIVVCELVWVLDSAYGYSRTEIASLLEKLLVTRQFEIESKDMVRQALRDYKAGGGDLADYIIGRTNVLNGCDVTCTFDRSLRGSSLFSVL